MKNCLKIKRIELLSSPQLKLITSSKTLESGKSEIVENDTMILKVIFKSNNEFEGQVSELIPQGPGQLYLGDGTGVTYQVTN